jgi:hypothetical protein
MCVEVLDSHMFRCKRRISEKEQARLEGCREGFSREIERSCGRKGGEEQALFSWREFLLAGGVTQECDVCQGRVRSKIDFNRMA